MTADRRAALVERVANLMRLCAYLCKPSANDCQCRADAERAIDLIRAEVLEEAARVAEYRCGASEWSAETNSGYECAAKEIAAAIRALKEKQ